MTRIAIVVPVRDGARYLGAAINSLAAGSRVPDEVIVVDDGSTDDSSLIARRLGATVIGNPGRGPAAARNAGVGASTADLIGFLDADDAALSSRLAIQSSLLEDREIDAAAGLARNVVAPGPEIPSLDSGAGAPFRPFTPGTLLLRRETWEQVGPYDEHIGVVGDTVEWAARARRAGVRWALHDDVVLARRVHGENATTSPAAALGYLRLARKAIEQHRQGTA